MVKIESSRKAVAFYGDRTHACEWEREQSQPDEQQCKGAMVLFQAVVTTADRIICSSSHEWILNN